MRHPATAGFVCLLLLALAPAGGAVEPAYLADWPTVERVLADHQGTDRADTMARQMAALNQLSLAIDELAGPRRWREGHTADEQRLRGQYYDAAEKIRSEAHATLSDELGPGFHGPFAKAPLRKWYAEQWAYEKDPAGRRATLSRYLPAGLVAQFDAAVGSPPEKPKEPGDWGWLVWVGIGLVAIVLLRKLVGAARRRVRRAKDTPPEPDSTAPASDRSDAASNDIYQAAATEVLDTLAPYIEAARPDGRRIPLERLLQPFVSGFLMQYAGTALSAIEATGRKHGKDETAKVLKRLLHDPRIAEWFSRDGLDDAVRTARKENFQALVQTGQFVASLILAAYEDEKIPDDNFVLSTVQVFDRAARKSGVRLAWDDPDRMRLRSTPSATRLHPARPHAAQVQRAVLVCFTGRLIEQSAED